MTDSLRQQWNNDGYVLFKSLLSEAEVGALLTIAERVRRQWIAASAENGTPGDPEGHNMRHVNHPGYFRDNPDEFVTLMNLIADERILGIGRDLFGTEPVFRATTLWFEPNTAQEDGSWHRDIQFMHPDEDEQRRMVGKRSVSDGMQLQIALLETADNEYVPGSHLRWDMNEEYHIRLADAHAHSRSNKMPGAVRIHQQPGDALAFEALGLHRGRYHADKRRRTLMLTYTSEREQNFDYFSDQPWLDASPLMAILPASTQAFFRRFVDIYADDLRHRSAVAAEFRT